MDVLYGDRNLLMRETRRRWQMIREQIELLRDEADSALPDEWYGDDED